MNVLIPDRLLYRLLDVLRMVLEVFGRSLDILDAPERKVRKISESFQVVKSIRSFACLDDSAIGAYDVNLFALFLTPRLKRRDDERVREFLPLLARPKWRLRCKIGLENGPGRHLRRLDDFQPCVGEFFFDARKEFLRQRF